MKFTKIPQDTMQHLQLNAGVLLSAFDPATASVPDTAIIGATTGGVSFDATPTYSDWGSDIDNCPKNVKELKKLDSWEAKMSGTFLTVKPNTAKQLVGAADVSSTKVTPRADLKDADFTDLWWVGDYSDQNGETNGGYVAIHMMNTLSTGGFKIQSGDKKKGNFGFEFTAHYSIANQTEVPFEIYIKEGTAEA